MLLPTIPAHSHILLCSSWLSGSVWWEVSAPLKGTTASSDTCWKLLLDILLGKGLSQGTKVQKGYFRILLKIKLCPLQWNGCPSNPILNGTFFSTPDSHQCCVGCNSISRVDDFNTCSILPLNFHCRLHFNCIDVFTLVVLVSLPS